MYPPELSPEDEEYLLTELEDWSLANGLAVKPQPTLISNISQPHGSLVTTAPVTVFPSPFPKDCFQEGIDIQSSYNELYAAISCDEEWLGAIVRELAGIDDFVAKLWQIHLSVIEKGGYAQDFCLGLFRSDYMLHVDDDVHGAPRLRQVEFNTIASSFGGLSAKVSHLHRHLLDSRAYPTDVEGLKAESLPSPLSIDVLADGLRAAHSHYGESRTGHELCMLFIVQRDERNIFDQRHLEQSLKESGLVFRLVFDETLNLTRVDEDRNLLFTPRHGSVKYEVSTVYFRAGYSPAEYTSPEHWDMRLHIERSAAIKCPGVMTQLAGCKKVQQVLAEPGSDHVERFLRRDASMTDRIRSTFAPMYPLDTSEAGRQGRQLATDETSAKRFVLKPQREGGGNNIYRGAIVPFLQKTPENQWPAYILMEMIDPPPARNVILRNGVVEKGAVICELGVFGTCLWRHSDGNVLHDGSGGYLLRTKGDQSEEGGVAAGFGAVDSCCLY